MDDQKRGDDAEDHAPKPDRSKAKPSAAEKQDAPNYKERADEGRAIEVENVNSANDEGAG